MSRFFESGKDIGRYLIFLVVIILIYLGMPKEGKFKYEYSLNELWKHDDLIAPFTFAIKKTQDEVDQEENQIRESIKPYYNKVTEAEKSITDKLYNSFNYFVKQGFDTLSPIIQTLAKTRVKSTILTVFDAGIVLEKPQHKSINILHNNISKEYVTTNLYTLDDALNYISREIESDTHFGEHINMRAIRKLVEPNLSYNADLTEKKIEEELNKISVSKGIVQEGTKIIAKGNAVTEEKFQILESLRTEYEIKLDGGERNYFIHIGYLLLVTLVIIGFAIYLRQFYKPIYTSKNIILILINILGFILIGSYVVSSQSLDIYLVPFCIVPIILISFFDARIAFFSHLITVIIVSLFAPNGFEFLFIQVMVGMAVIIGISRVRYLSQFFIASLVILFVYYISFFGVKLVQVNSLRDIDYTTFLWFTGNFLLTLLAYPLIFAFEKIFGFVSDITLIEMSDLKQKTSEGFIVKSSRYIAAFVAGSQPNRSCLK
jgi:membrane-associated HD superfamily phosphohydrolase